MFFSIFKLKVSCNTTSTPTSTTAAITYSNEKAANLLNLRNDPIDPIDHDDINGNTIFSGKSTISNKNCDTIIDSLQQNQLNNDQKNDLTSNLNPIEKTNLDHIDNTMKYSNFSNNAIENSAQNKEPCTLVNNTSAVYKNDSRSAVQIKNCKRQFNRKVKSQNVKTPNHFYAWVGGITSCLLGIVYIFLRSNI